MNVSRREALRLAAVSALFVGGAGALAACSSSSPTTSTPAASGTGSSGGAVTLDLWTWTNAPGASQVAAVIAGYRKLHPNVTINNNDINNDDFKTKAQLALDSNQPIDILAVQPNLFASQVQAKLLPLSQWQSFMPAGTLSKYTPLSLAQLKKLFTGGETYAVPWAVSGSAAGFYNVALLEKAGLSEPPKTWDDMRTLADGLKSKAPGTAVAVMPAGSTDGWFLDEFTLTLVGQSDPNFFDTVRYDNGKWDTPAYVAALTELSSLYSTGALDKNVLDLGYTDAQDLFYKGQSAILFNGSWESTDLSAAYRKANKISISNVGAMGVPTSDGSAPSLRSFLDITLGIPKTCKNVEVAADFIAYATAGDGVPLWADSLGEIPALNGWAPPSSALTTPQSVQGYTLLQDLIAHPHSDRNNLSAFSSQVGVRIESMLNNGVSPTATAAACQSDLDSGKYS
jgi:ABC-type glycerol-3-phosphate transport system substrate-binding protein